MAELKLSGLVVPLACSVAAAILTWRTLTWHQIAVVSVVCILSAILASIAAVDAYLTSFLNPGWAFAIASEKFPALRAATSLLDFLSSIALAVSGALIVATVQESFDGRRLSAHERRILCLILVAAPPLLLLVAFTRPTIDQQHCSPKAQELSGMPFYHHPDTAPPPAPLESASAEILHTLSTAPVRAAIGFGDPITFTGRWHPYTKCNDLCSTRSSCDEECVALRAMDKLLSTLPPHFQLDPNSEFGRMHARLHGWYDSLDIRCILPDARGPTPFPRWLWAPRPSCWRESSSVPYWLREIRYSLVRRQAQTDAALRLLPDLDRHNPAFISFSDVRHYIVQDVLDQATNTTARQGGTAESLMGHRGGYLISIVQEAILRAWREMLRAEVAFAQLLVQHTDSISAQYAQLVSRGATDAECAQLNRDLHTLHRGWQTGIGGVASRPIYEHALLAWHAAFWGRTAPAERLRSPWPGPNNTNWVWTGQHWVPESDDDGTPRYYHDLPSSQQLERRRVLIDAAFEAHYSALRTCASESMPVSVCCPWWQVWYASAPELGIQSARVHLPP